MSVFGARTFLIFFGLRRTVDALNPRGSCGTSCSMGLQTLASAGVAVGGHGGTTLPWYFGKHRAKTLAGVA